MINNVLKEAERLHGLGFAILWIKPKSKAPVKSKWTTGPRETWNQLKASYRPGFNVGVRLGTPSVIDGKYLACIDIDVHDDKFKVKAETILSTILNGTRATIPEVISGSGTGSKHLYCVTDKPFKMQTIIKEAEGEICIYSDGRQMVLAPSIHPTGKPYQWLRSLNKKSDLPTIDLGGIQAHESKREMTNDWKPEEYDLTFSNLDKEIIDLILFADCDNRSDQLLKVSAAMVKEGLTDRQILSVLTDREYELGKTAYDHAKTDSRARAVNWLFNYTLKKARKENDANLQFNNEVEISELSEEEATAQATLLVQPVSWQSKLNRTKAGKLSGTLNNVLLILENDFGSGLFKRDVFALNDMYGMDTPWKGKKGESITDDDIRNLKVWFIKRHKIEPSNAVLEDAIGFIAVENSFHPVRDYLDKLEWDGVRRLDTWLRVYMGASMKEPYLSAVSRKTLCAMVARIYHPGIKFDHVLILNGRQGIGKSTAAQILASPPWFLDRLPDLRDKDSMINLQGIWVAEMGELTNMRLSSVETYKAFLSSQVDKFRLPYGSRRQDFKRQCVIIGSSNPTEFLNDETGNRRFWPVTVKQCNFKALTTDRNQLLAEAKFVWENCGEKLYLDSEEEKQATEIQQKHMNENVDTFLDEKWDDFEAQNNAEIMTQKFKLESLFDPMGVFAYLSFSKDAKKVAKLLRKKGFMKFVAGGGQKWWAHINSPEMKKIKLENEN